MGQGAIVKVISNSGRMGQTFVTPLWRGKGRVPARSATARGPVLSSPTRLSWVFPGYVLNSPGLPCLSRACSGSVLNSPIALPHNADNANFTPLLVSSAVLCGHQRDKSFAQPHAFLGDFIGLDRGMDFCLPWNRFFAWNSWWNGFRPHPWNGFPSHFLQRNGFRSGFENIIRLTYTDG